MFLLSFVNIAEALPEEEEDTSTGLNIEQFLPIIGVALLALIMIAGLISTGEVSAETLIMVIIALIIMIVVVATILEV
jgi:hypothetical protein